MARTRSGPNIPSTRPQSKPNRFSSVCNSATSSPRVLGERRNNKRSPNDHDASMSADHVCSSTSPVARKPYESWNAKTAACVRAQKVESSAAPGARKPAAERRRCKSCTAGPRWPGLIGQLEEMEKAPRACDPLASHRRSCASIRHQQTTTWWECSSR